jgi:hypothetical protein
MTSTMPVVLVGHSNSSNPRGGTLFWYKSSDHLKTSLGLFVLRVCRKATSDPLFLLRLAWPDAKRVLRNIGAALCVFLTEHSIAYHPSTRQGNFFTSIAVKGALLLVTYWDKILADLCGWRLLLTEADFKVCVRDMSNACYNSVYFLQKSAQ